MENQRHEAIKKTIILIIAIILMAIPFILLCIEYIFYYLRHHPPAHSHSHSPSPKISPSPVNFPDDSSMKSRGLLMLGDSSADCGENSLFCPVFLSNFSSFHCSQGPDSLLIPYFLAKKMNLPSIPTFYEQNGTLEGILNGLNYGSAQATILTRASGLKFQSLSQQLRQAFETIQLLQLQLGEVEAQNFISSSVFYLSLGKDYFINLLFENSTFSSDFSGNSQMIPRLLVDEVTNALRNLYDGGVRKVVVMEIYPLGCAPREVVNQLISQHNQLLNDHIINLNMALSDANFVFCDFFEGFRQILYSPQKFGFDDIRAACCGGGWHGAAEGCHSMDFYNPTEAVYSILADAAWSGQSLGDICHPMNIQALVNA